MGELLFDQLLGLIGLDATFYPPSSQQHLEQLYDTIMNAPMDLLHRHCFVYYLLKDFNNGIEKKYAIEYTLPDGFVKAIEGLWIFDSGNYIQSIRLFCDVGVDVDWVDLILATLIGKKLWALAMQFVTAKGVSNWKSPNLVMDVYAHTDFHTALKFYRMHKSVLGQESLLTLFENAKDAELMQTWFEKDEELVLERYLKNYNADLLQVIKIIRGKLDGSALFSGIMTFTLPVQRRIIAESTESLFAKQKQVDNEDDVSEQASHEESEGMIEVIEETEEECTSNENVKDLVETEIEATAEKDINEEESESSVKLMEIFEVSQHSDELMKICEITSASEQEVEMNETEIEYYSQESEPLDTPATFAKSSTDKKQAAAEQNIFSQVSSIRAEASILQSLQTPVKSSVPTDITSPINCSSITTENSTVLQSKIPTSNSKKLTTHILDPLSSSVLTMPVQAVAKPSPQQRQTKAGTPTKNIYEQIAQESLHDSKNIQVQRELVRQIISQPTNQNIPKQVSINKPTTPVTARQTINPVVTTEKKSVRKLPSVTTTPMVPSQKSSATASPVSPFMAPPILPQKAVK